MFSRISALLALLAGALMLVAGAGAGAGSQQPKKIALTDANAVNSYLTSIGVNPATVVRQVGLLNYAGPNCPGVGWNCTTSRKSVQVTVEGGTNKFECTPAADGSDPDSNTCLIMQSGDDNKVHCKLSDFDVPTASQRCIVSQDGERNLAIVDETIEQSGGSTQSANQLADVSQTAVEKNEVQIDQDVEQSTNSAGSQAQNVKQVAVVNQWATGSSNVARVHQDQDLRASGAATQQQQNVAPLPGDIPDCDAEHKSTNPNACVSIAQTVSATGGGKNQTNLHQNVSERAQTTLSNASQLQEAADTGIEADIDQSNPEGAGNSQKTVHQGARQRAEGPAGTNQVQIIDPNCCGIGTTVGGVNNQDDIHQAALQGASEGAAALQRLGILGDTNHVPEGGPELTSESDTCTIHHNARNNSDSTNVTLTFDPCTGPIVVETECFQPTARRPAGCTDPEADRPSFVITSFAASTFLRRMLPGN